MRRAPLQIRSSRASRATPLPALPGAPIEPGPADQLAPATPPTPLAPRAPFPRIAYRPLDPRAPATPPAPAPQESSTAIPSDTILIADDDPRLRRLVRLTLERAGWPVQEAATGAETLDAALAEPPPALVLLDVVLPDIDGFDVLRRLRESSAIPVVMLSGLDAEDDRVTGLDLGADDYIAKPFGVRELVARVRATLRRVSPQRAAPDRVSLGPLSLDLAMRRAEHQGATLDLTPIEFDLLSELALHQGRVLLPADLLRAVWGPSYTDDRTLLRTAVWRLRKKLNRAGLPAQLVQTVPRVGYTLNPPPHH